MPSPAARAGPVPRPARSRTGTRRARPGRRGAGLRAGPVAGVGARGRPLRAVGHAGRTRRACERAVGQGQQHGPRPQNERRPSVRSHGVTAGTSRAGRCSAAPSASWDGWTPTSLAPGTGPACRTGPYGGPAAGSASGARRAVKGCARQWPNGDAEERTVAGESADPGRRPGRYGAQRRQGGRGLPRDPGDGAGGAAGEGHAHRQHDQAAAGGGAGGPSRRGQPQPPQGDPRQFGEGARGRPGAGAGRGAGAALPALHGRGHPQRRGAAHRAGPAGGLAGGALPRDPDDALRPADGGAGPAGADAPRPAARRRRGTRGLPTRAVAQAAPTCNAPDAAGDAPAPTHRRARHGCRAPSLCPYA